MQEERQNLIHRLDACIDLTQRPSQPSLWVRHEERKASETFFFNLDPRFLVSDDVLDVRAPNLWATLTREAFAYLFPGVIKLMLSSNPRTMVQIAGELQAQCHLNDRVAHLTPELRHLAVEAMEFVLPEVPEADRTVWADSFCRLLRQADEDAGAPSS